MSDAQRQVPRERVAVQVEILGDKYAIRTDADEAYTRRCAALVDERMREIAQAGSANTRKTAIMAALSLSDDLFRQREELDERVRVLAGRLQSVLEE